MRRTRLLGLGLLALFALLAAALLAGGVLGLKPVPTSDWGGLMLTVLIAAWSMVTSIPLGLLLALGRRSALPVIAYACAIFIEVWRSLPLIGVLFLAVVMFPLFVPQGFESDKLVRALIAFTLFNAAIFAEVFRGGLQAIPAGQHEAAKSLGLGYWRTTALIVLPQVVRIVLPGMINTCVSIIKETTVVLVIGLVEFLAVLQIAFADPDWLIGDQVRATGYLFAALVFWSLCFALSRYSARLDRTHRISP
jgi:general L-amino acid transport system permease protein